MWLSKLADWGANRLRLVNHQSYHICISMLLNYIGVHILSGVSKLDWSTFDFEFRLISHLSTSVQVLVIWLKSVGEESLVMSAFANFTKTTRYYVSFTIKLHVFFGGQKCTQALCFSSSQPQIYSAKPQIEQPQFECRDLSLAPVDMKRRKVLYLITTLGKNLISAR